MFYLSGMHIRSNWFPLLLGILIVFMLIKSGQQYRSIPSTVATVSDADCWTGAGLNQIPVNADGEKIRYGRDLIANTAYYFGPKGIVAHSSNGMNCQNCHLEAGTKPWGSNFGAVTATYPRMSGRSGMMEGIEKRVNDCFERSLNGKAIDTSSKEMKAMVAYIKWLGKGIPKGSKPKGSGIMDLPYLTEAADAVKGKKVYTLTCERCHGKNGEGQMNVNDMGYAYPPLWGEHSYNNGAGLYRLSRLAGFLKNNMPNPTTYHNPRLTNKEAWDVAAYINSQPRPAKNLSKDWPDISLKPVDHPFGPFADSFSEIQHKYGPFAIMKKKK